MDVLDTLPSLLAPLISLRLHRVQRKYTPFASGCVWRGVLVAGHIILYLLFRVLELGVFHLRHRVLEMANKLRCGEGDMNRSRQRGSGGMGRGSVQLHRLTPHARFSQQCARLFITAFLLSRFLYCVYAAVKKLHCENGDTSYRGWVRYPEALSRHVSLGY